MTASYNARAYREFFEHEFTYLDGFRRNTGRYANRVAVTDPATGHRWTYAELGDQVDGLATGLAGPASGAAMSWSTSSTTDWSSPSSTWPPRPVARSAHRSTSGSPRARPRTSSTTAPRGVRLRHRAHGAGAGGARARVAHTRCGDRRRCRRAAPVPGAVVRSRPARRPGAAAAEAGTAPSATRPPGCTPRAPPACPRACRSTAWSRSSAHTT